MTTGYLCNIIYSNALTLKQAGDVRDAHCQKTFSFNPYFILQLFWSWIRYSSNFSPITMNIKYMFYLLLCIYFKLFFQLCHLPCLLLKVTSGTTWNDSSKTSPKLPLGIERKFHHLVVSRLYSAFKNCIRNIIYLKTI